MVSTILNLSGNIWNLFNTGLLSLFVPSENFFKDKIDGLSSNFGFVNLFFNMGKVVVDACSGSSTGELLSSAGSSSGVVSGGSGGLSSAYNFVQTDESGAPVVTIPMSKTNTYFDYGDSFTVSFSWFAPYREDFHFIISMFLWIVFIWNNFKNLPSTISGVGSALYTTSDVAETVTKE